MNLTLQRGPQDSVCTEGRLLREDGSQVCVTLERPWQDNTPMVSCIPAGVYTVKLSEHPIHGQVYEVQNVEGRTAILLHKGNFAADTEGCILLGSKQDQDSIDASEAAFDSFMQEMQGVSEFTLTILDPVEASS